MVSDLEDWVGERLLGREAGDGVRVNAAQHEILHCGEGGAPTLALP